MFFSVEKYFFSSIILTYGNRNFSGVYPKLYPSRCSQGISDKKKNRSTLMVKRFSYGTPGGIRTPDPLVRSQILYPAELLALMLS